MKAKETHPLIIKTMKVLKDIEAGKITVYIQPDLMPITPDSPTNIPYILSNGWYIGVFNDGGSWDYINYIVDDDPFGFDPWDDEYKIYNEKEGYYDFNDVMKYFPPLYQKIAIWGFKE